MINEDDLPPPNTLTTTDSAKIQSIVLFGMWMQVLKHLVNLICMSYFTGLIWYNYCDLTSKWDDGGLNNLDPDQGFFI